MTTLASPGGFYGATYGPDRSRLPSVGMLARTRARSGALVANKSSRTNRLLKKVARQDRAAFSELYDEVAPMVYGIALRVVRDPARAEEISQEAFLQVWEQAVRFDARKGSARAWIATLAHRRAVDTVRSEQASRRRTDIVGARSVAPEYDVVSEEAERSDEAERIRAALDRLTPSQRECIALAYFGGRTYREVAEELDSPIGTVKTRMRTALMSLRDMLGDDHG